MDGGVESTDLVFPGEGLPPSSSSASTDPMWHQPLSCQLCSINRVKVTLSPTHTYTHKETHTHTQPLIKTQLFPVHCWLCSGQLCLCPSLVPAAEVTLPKMDREDTALMRPRGGFEVWAHVCVCERMCACITAGVLIWNDPALLSSSTTCLTVCAPL